MTKDEAREILKHHNLWRRNQDDVNPYEMCDPKELGIAIEVAIEALEQPKLTDEKGRPMTYWGGLEQPAQEPVAWMNDIAYGETYEELDGDFGKVIPLYIHPHQWQGLTDDEVQDVFNLGHKTFKEFAYAIEQALRENNT